MLFRSVATAHLAAMTIPAAAGQRFPCIAERFWIQDAAEILNKHFEARGYKIKTTVMPSWLVRIVAIFLKQIRPTLQSLDREIFIDTALIRKTLNWQPRSLETTLVDMAESMIELKLV